MKSTRSLSAAERPSPHKIGSRKLALIALGTLMLVGIVFSGLFLSGAYFRSHIADKITELGLPATERRQSILSSPGNYLRSVFSSEEIETLLIDIKFKHMAKLRAARDEALEKNVINTTGDDFVPATIRYRDRSVRVHLRLKGDLTDHLQGDKWSFMVKVRGGDQLMGMRRFSLMNPHVREDQYGPVAYDYMRSLDILTPRYFHVNLVVNGSNIGVMALEEYPAKELMESQGRRESVIVRFDESQLWDDLTHKGYLDDRFNNYTTTPFRVVQGGKVRKSPKLVKSWKTAAGLLKGFYHGELTGSQVFNVEEFARYLAATEILNAPNGLWWGNLRFYYNPVTAKLEPFASDLMSDYQHSDPEMDFQLRSHRDLAARKILDDPEIRSAFVSELRRLSEEMENGTTEALLAPLEKKYREILHREMPFLMPMDFERMKRRATHLAAVTEENFDYFNTLGEEGHSALINVQESRDGQEGLLELANIIDAPVEVISINWRSNSGDAETAFQATREIEYPIEIDPTSLDREPGVALIPFRYSPDIADGSEIEVVARIKGTNRNYTTTGMKNFIALSERPIPVESVSATLERHPYLKQPDDATFRLEPGSHVVPTTISIPQGYDLQISAGTTLFFAPDAMLIVRGALNMSGTPDRPIVLDGQNAGTGESGWRGLIVIDAQNPSLWRHVHIRNTTGVMHGDWEQTGGVTLYQSDALLERVYFDTTGAEDALNIIRSNFEMKDVEIRNTFSDGFDSDYSNGIVENGLFENIGTAGGGDAVDISGSEVSVIGTRFKQISDKALSVGEGSRMIAKNVQIDDALTGAASKDASRLEISSSKIINAQIAGMMAYVKKPEYGPASINATQVEFIGTSSNSLAQTGSEITIDGNTLASQHLNVDQLYGSFMKKAQRQ